MQPLDITVTPKVPRPQTPAQPTVIIRATDIHTGPLDCASTGDQDLALGHSLGPGISFDLGNQLALPIMPFFTTLTSQDLPLSPALPRATLPGIHSNLKPFIKLYDSINQLQIPKRFSRVMGIL